MWFNARKGDLGVDLMGGQELFECTIQCEVKNILYAFIFVFFVFTSLCFCFSFILESTKKLKQCAQPEKSL